MDLQSPQETPKPATIPCDVCGKSFMRPEHLRRHISTSHNVDRKWPCDTCGKEFVRRDALQRHTLTHKNTEPNLIRKGGRACTACSAAKARCTGEEPICSRCRQRDSECVYPTSGRKLAQSGRTPERSIQPAMAEIPVGDHAQTHASMQQPHPYEMQNFDPQYWDGTVQSINWLPLDFPEYVDVSPAFDNSLDPFAWANAYNIGFENEVPLQVPSAARRVDAPLLTPQDPSPVSLGPGPSPSDSNRTRGSEVGEYYVDGEPARLPRVKRRRLSTRPLSTSTPYSNSRDFSLAITWDRHPTSEETPWTPISDDVYQAIVRTVLYFGQQTSAEYSQPTTPSSLFSQQFNPDIPSKDNLEFLLGLFAKNVLPLLPVLHTTKLHSLGWQLTLAAVALGSHFVDGDATRFTTSMHELLRRIFYVAEEDPRWIPERHTEMLQVKLLHCVGLLYCGEQRLEASGHKLLTELTHTIRASKQPVALPAPQSASLVDQFQHFIDTETFSRTWYGIWLLENQQTYQQQTQPVPYLSHIMPPLPCPPRTWNALTAVEWSSHSTVVPPTLLSALETLYTTKAFPVPDPSLSPTATFCEYSRVLLIHGIFARTWSVADYFSQPLSLWTPSARQSNTPSSPIKSPWLPANEVYAKWRNSACDVLDTLHWSANATIGENKGLEHPTILHLHVARVVLLTPYNEIVSLAQHLAGEKAPAVSATEAAQQVKNDKAAIRRWAAQDQYKARLAMIHAGVMFWHVRRFGVGGWYEADAIALSTLALWAFSAFSERAIRTSRAASKARQQQDGQQLNQRPVTNETSAAAAPSQLDHPASASADDDEEEQSSNESESLPSLILLDRPTDDELVQQFVRNGDKMKAHMNGVGDIYEAKAPEKVLLEGKKIVKGLGSSAGVGTWGRGRRWVGLLEGLVRVRGGGKGK